MNNIQVQCFLTSAQTLSFTKTAQLLYISQPTITHHIQNLEAELGFSLFVRNKKQLFLTPAGEKFYTSLKKISSELNEAVLLGRQLESKYDNHLCIGCGSSEFEQEFLPIVLQNFQKQYPKIYITYNSNQIREMVKLFQQRTIDVLFSSTQMIKGFPTVKYYDLRDYPIICVMNKENPLAGLDRITIHDLQNQNLIFAEFSLSTPEMDILQKQLSTKYSRNISHHIENASIAHLMILSNMGIAIMPEFKYQKHNNLVALPYVDYPAISYGIAKQKNDSREFVDSFIKTTQTVFKEMYSKSQLL